MPPKLKCHCDLDLWPRNPKFNRGHLLVMTNHHTKLEDPWAMSSLVIDRTRFVYGPTKRPTDWHVQSNISPLLRRGHNDNCLNWSFWKLKKHDNIMSQTHHSQFPYKECEKTSSVQLNLTFEEWCVVLIQWSYIYVPIFFRIHSPFENVINLTIYFHYIHIRNMNIQCLLWPWPLWLFCMWHIQNAGNFLTLKINDFYRKYKCWEHVFKR